MTNYEKQELLVALCGYLPNKLKIQTTCADDSIHELICAYFDDETGEYEFMDNCGLSWDIGDFKPYLRPMSSMTEDELKELAYTILQQPDLEFVRKFELLSADGKEIYKTVDWLNKHHFDYRGLIERGFAIESPENLYNC